MPGVIITLTQCIICLSTVVENFKESFLNTILSGLCDVKLYTNWILCSVSVGWMCCPPARTPWAPSHPQTLTAWRSSSSIMTSTTAGTWRQRPTGIMKTVQHVFSSVHASRLSQVGFNSGMCVQQHHHTTTPVVSLLVLISYNWKLVLPLV